MLLTQKKAELKKALEELAKNPVEIPLMIGSEAVKTGDVEEIRSPHNKSLVLGKYHKAGEKEIKKIIEVALEARKKWSEMEWYDRASIFLRSAELLATKYRYIMNAATMHGQSKTAFQAEIDSACELIDFLRFNTYYMQEIYKEQPWSSKGIWNRVEYRPMEGFIFAVTPFNFTAIGGNLPTSPAMMEMLSC
jgi:1-pyrroline-5-carboxylate dehydrogenase